MNRPEPFDSVYQFCSGDDDIYWEIIEEIQKSIQNLEKVLKEKILEIDQLKFIAHKMKSTFRMLKDEQFKAYLDDYVTAVEGEDQGSIDNNGELLMVKCKTYSQLLEEELERR